MTGKVQKKGLKRGSFLRLFGRACVSSDVTTAQVNLTGLEVEEVMPKNFVRKSSVDLYCGQKIERIIPVKLKDERHKYVRRNLIFLFPTQ